MHSHANKTPTNTHICPWNTPTHTHTCTPTHVCGHQQSHMCTVHRRTNKHTHTHTQTQTQWCRPLAFGSFYVLLHFLTSTQKTSKNKIRTKCKNANVNANTPTDPSGFHADILCWFKVAMNHFFSGLKLVTFKYLFTSVIQSQIRLEIQALKCKCGEIPMSIKKHIHLADST